MNRIAAITVALCLTGFAAATQPMLPRCSEALDGQFSEGGCSCGYDRGGQLTGRAAGWRWKCDLLRGPGPTAPVEAAGPPPQSLPPGTAYAPSFTRNGTTASSGSSSTGQTTTGTSTTGTAGVAGTSLSGTSLPSSMASTATTNRGMRY